MFASLFRRPWESAVLLPALVVAVALDTVAADKPPPESPAIATARQYVAEALQAEVAGDNKTRAARLDAALAAAPDFAPANWHSGRVRMGDQWLPLADADKHAADDAQLREYQQLRTAAADSTPLLKSLARWCAKAGWDDRAKLHYAQLLQRADSGEDVQREAIKNLDLHFVGGQWIEGDELKQRQAQAKAADQALRKLRPRLERLQAAIDDGSHEQRTRAIEQLAGFTDLELIPVLESFLNAAGDEFQVQAIRRLSAFPDYPATETLVRYAVLADSVVVRDEAAKALQKRPTYDYLPLLLGALAAPLQSRYEVRKLPSGAVAYSHALVRETPNQRNIALAELTVNPLFIRRRWVRGVHYDNTVWFDQERIASRAELHAAGVRLQANLASDQADRQNRRIFAVLTTATEQSLPDQPVAWWNWWQRHNEYDLAKQINQTYTSETTQYVTRPPVQVGGSCFFAGTLVRTETGLVPVESIEPGDRVLAQDQDTGELQHQVVLRRTLRPAAAMLRITAGGETIITTHGHPFWVNGHGWKMAKELASGDVLHTLTGALPIESLGFVPGQHPAHNLVVGGFNTYFVGNSSLLVHDNEFRTPTRALVPGLTETNQVAARK